MKNQYLLLLTLYSNPGTDLFSAPNILEELPNCVVSPLATLQSNIILVSMPIVFQNYFLKGH